MIEPRQDRPKEPPLVLTCTASTVGILIPVLLFTNFDSIILFSIALQGFGWYLVMSQDLRMSLRLGVKTPGRRTGEGGNF